MPVLAAVIPAGVGALVITVVTFSQLFVWPSTDQARLPLLGLVYAPVLAWGPLLGILTYDYLRRHRRR